MKNTIIIAVLVVVGLGIYFFSPSTPAQAPTVASPTAQAPATQAPASAVQTVAPSEVSVNIKGFAFSPANLTVKAGTKVTWTNNDSVPHTVTSDTGTILNSPTLSQGQSWSFTFAAAGTVAYHCKVHPMMKATVVVQ